MIAGVSTIERRLTFGEACPVEIPAIDDNATDRGAMATKIFGCRIDDNCRTMFERTRNQRRGGVVDDQWNAQLPPDGCDLGNWKDRELGVWQGFRIVGAGAFIRCRTEGFRVCRVYETNFDTLITQCVCKQVPGAAVKIG